MKIKAYHKPIVFGLWMFLAWIVYFNIRYFSERRYQVEGIDTLCNLSMKNWHVDVNHSFFVNSSIYKVKPSNLMTLPKLEFLPNLRNPCFYVRNPPEDDQGVWVDNRTVLKCWPAFQLIGVEKCGTTDLYEKLHLHHHLLTMVNYKNGKVAKESLWYNGYIRPEPHNHTLGGYLGLMDNATRHIFQHCKNNISPERGGSKAESPCPYMVSDFSARTMNQNYYWYKDEPNQQYYFPKYLTADKVHHVFPQTKILVMLRNPTERTLSDYRFYRGSIFKNNVTQEDFDRRILLAIKTWNQCTFTMRVDPEKCAEGYNWTLVDRTVKASYWSNRSPDRIRIGLYSIFLKRWLLLFPRENIHVIKMEEYSKSPVKYIEKYVLPFLGLEPFRPDTRRAIEATNNKQSNRNYASYLNMWNSTRKTLNEFYAPYNLQLSEMLHNEKFLWNG